jgi:hypothetical protein
MCTAAPDAYSSAWQTAPSCTILFADGVSPVANVTPVQQQRFVDIDSPMECTQLGCRGYALHYYDRLRTKEVSSWSLACIYCEMFICYTRCLLSNQLFSCCSFCRQKEQRQYGMAMFLEDA